MGRILYVPLDDRPVNTDDVIMQGKSAGIEVITPNTASIRNRLDSQLLACGSSVTSTYSPTFGDPANIRQFIVNHADSVDGFIISIDMLVYGGLIGSRRLRPTSGGTYPHYDSTVTGLLDTLKQIKQRYPHKPIYVLDTVMRLATTPFVESETQDSYTESRSFMQQTRKTETEFEPILNGYDLRPDGTAFGDPVHFNKEQYYHARRHKFKTNRYVLEQLAKQQVIDFLAIGVDDASTEGVQMNEINWIEARINEWLDGTNGQNRERAIILPDADGLGHCLLARMVNHLQHGSSTPRFQTRYYGPHGSTIINPYEYMNIEDNIRHHVEITGGDYVTSGPYDIEIISITSSAEADNAARRMAANGKKQLPTIVIDFVGAGPADPTVTHSLLATPFTGRILGYSGWNTAGNKIGIAVGMGQARYDFLKSETEAEALNIAVNAHGSLLFKRFLKDYYYKRETIGDIRAISAERSTYTNVAPDQNMLLFNTSSDYLQLTAILREQMQAYTSTLAAEPAFCASYNIRQINGSSWNLSAYRSASLAYGNPEFSWGRAFEITLNPTVTLG
ncbi:DUF4127 family protein [Halalkalibacter oceani]|uniref:DUF4127 family protein n=1 Tax=Halalkalibacter oceani TaxID=1653776 RepID=UPI003392C554